MTDRVRIFVVGLGRMGAAHASAYHRNPGFEIVGLMSRNIRRESLPKELQNYPIFTDFRQGMTELRPDAVSINSYPDTHAAYAIEAMEAGAHVFLEKPIATTIEDAERVVATAVRTRRKLVLGYILRVHPTWIRFIELGRTLGKPLAMRLSLNQQSSGDGLLVHRNLLQSIGPLADVGVHYVDVMCQLTGARPVRVHGIGAPLWPGAPRNSYGQLQVTFDDGSVGWFETGWGPMMSESAFFVRDVIAPMGQFPSSAARRRAVATPRMSSFTRAPTASASTTRNWTKRARSPVPTTSSRSPMSPASRSFATASKRTSSAL